MNDQVQHVLIPVEAIITVPVTVVTLEMASHVKVFYKSFKAPH